ncbi:hypothetical protein S83_067068 [Arachis hypogaea]
MVGAMRGREPQYVGMEGAAAFDADARRNKGTVVVRGTAHREWRTAVAGGDARHDEGRVVVDSSMNRDGWCCGRKERQK